ncbi:MBL fold metallo-hydrolase [Haliangium sp.]|uniref:MBL fold metallo-hydrolase n=1 Tax=Haliangium sp. TaxID=2663208 RepID=UPI003D0A3EF4
MIRRRLPAPLPLTFALPLTLVLGCASSAQPPTTPTPAEPTLHTFTSDQNGFDTHTYYLDTGSEVVVFDAQFTPALAQAMVDDIRAHTDSPIRYLVITHPNPDKFNGASVFRELGAQIVASRATAEAIPGVHAYKKYYFVNVAGMFTEDDYPTPTGVDLVFDDELVLDLDGAEEVRLRVLDHAGVSSTQTVASIPSLDALVVGDLIHHGVHAWLEGGIVDGAPQPDLSAWRAALDELSEFGNPTVYAGRGEPAALDEAAPAQAAYLAKVDDLTRAYVAEVGAPALLGDDASTHHAALAERIKAAFPEYGLGYMADFSVYGLATAVASETAGDSASAAR